MLSPHSYLEGEKIEDVLGLLGTAGRWSISNALSLIGRSRVADWWGVSVVANSMPSIMTFDYWNFLWIGLQSHCLSFFVQGTNTTQAPSPSREILLFFWSYKGADFGVPISTWSFTCSYWSTFRSTSYIRTSYLLNLIFAAPITRWLVHQRAVTSPVTRTVVSVPPKPSALVANNQHLPATAASQLPFLDRNALAVGYPSTSLTIPYLIAHCCAPCRAP